MKQEHVWELSYHRKKYDRLEPNHVMVSVVAACLGDAVRAADALYGETHNCWTAKHIGLRVLIHATPTSSVPQEDK